jgi:hypothetical protein
MISRLKTGLFLAAGIVLLLGLNFFFDRLDEATGCDLADHAWDCAVSHTWKAFHNWMYADDYKQFLTDGPAHDSFIRSLRVACIEHHKAKQPTLEKTNEQIAAYCDCYAENLAALAAPTDLRYIAHHEEAPSGLKQRLDERAPECARLADSIGTK